MNSRRSFIKKSLAGAALLAFPLSGEAFFKKESTRIVILHTSDLHSRIDPFPKDHPHYPGKGGFAQRAAQIQKIRKENEHVLLFDSGDILQGTPYFNFYKGQPEFELMSRMGYDAATLGNHEFDNGLEALNQLLPHATFPFISANYHFENTALKGKISPWKIFQKGRVKIGVLGLGIDPKGLIADSNYRGMEWSNPLETGETTAAYLKQQGCHLVVALSHLGLQMDRGRYDDIQLAAHSTNIDLILGGHTHSFMERPLLTQNAAGKEIPILHSGQHGVQMGRLDFEFGSKAEESPYQLLNG
ncbi:bifunctional metallophosphatase/5'-nucleotidase [Geofilum rhodophaeum]|uniref:bifunctional metallophosphatase/5'-nucleotidase n=1 Tax=Geofilum rhodophaeum TaxID=1965019 RepID=UPI000B52821D|nr:metallophosphatase [Geofilum rhodophaeum]